MKRAAIAGGVVAAVLVLLALALAGGRRAVERDLASVEASSSAILPSTATAAKEAAPAVESTEAAAEAAEGPGFLYGRVATVSGDVYQGRLRWGGGEEAFWGDYFNGAKVDNPWVAHVPSELLPRERRPIAVFGLEILQRERPLDLGRLFMARFGDIARIEAAGRDVRVTLKSGTELVLDRFEASDFDDGVRVWDFERGVVDLGPRRIRTIELLPTARLGDVPGRLHGTVRTPRGDFTGFVQWDREACLGSDELLGRTADGEIRIRFDSLRAITRHARVGSRVTFLDGRELVVSGTREAGDGHRGIYVDDPRYGRVLVSWGAFEHLDLGDPGAAGSGPAYGDFPPGRPLTGSVTTRAGRRLAGRLVYDLDESETTETLDAPAQGVDYTLPFSRIATIDVTGGEERGAQPGRVTLWSGEELELERAGDLGGGNAGLLIFVDGRSGAEYVPWMDVERIDFDRPPEPDRQPAASDRAERERTAHGLRPEPGVAPESGD